MRPADKTRESASGNGPADHCKPGPACQESGARPRTVLLIDHDAVHAQRLIASLTTRRIGVDLCANIEQAAKKLRRIGGDYELVIVNISDASQPWLRLLRFLRESSIESGVEIGPRFLCVSTTEYNDIFEFQIGQMEGCLVYEY
jgi:PleD family two-component response regulator